MTKNSIMKTSDIRYNTDVICLSGHGASKYPANQMYRKFIEANKGYFASLTSKQEQEDFAVKLWMNLKDNGYRFLRPIGVHQYEILDTDKAIRKCHHALETKRTAMTEKIFVSIETLCNSSIKMSAELLPQTTAATVIQKREKQNVAPPPADKERLFDDTAMAAIEALLNRKEIKLAMDKNWGFETDVRKTLLRDSVRRVLIYSFYVCNHHTRTNDTSFSY
jgi:hypothetical protein